MCRLHERYNKGDTTPACLSDRLRDSLAKPYSIYTCSCLRLLCGSKRAVFVWVVLDEEAARCGVSPLHPLRQRTSPSKHPGTRQCSAVGFSPARLQNFSCIKMSQGPSPNTDQPFTTGPTADQAHFTPDISDEGYVYVSQLILPSVGSQCTRELTSLRSSRL